MILFADDGDSARVGSGASAASGDLSPSALAALSSARGAHSLNRGDLAALTDLTSRIDFGRRLQTTLNRDGLSFNGARDMYRALGYAEVLTPYDYWARYQRGGIAERIVEAFPRLTWSGEFSIVEDEDPETLTEYEAAAADLYSRLSVPSKLMRADIMAGLGHYSAMLLGTQLYEGQSLLTPLDKLAKGATDLLYLTPLDETRSKITRVVTDPGDPRFGLPETYLATLGAPIGPGYDYRTGVHSGSISLPVDHSRIVHIAEGCLADNVYGKPRLRSVWNLLDDLLKVVGGGSEATWIRANPGIQADLDPEIASKLSPDAKQAQADALEEYLHGARRWLRTVGTQLTAIGGGSASQVPVFGPNAMAILQLIAGTLGLPLRILIGSERAHLASTQDDENLRDRVAERRIEFAIPTVRDLNSRCEQIGALPTPRNPAYECVWPSIEELTEDAKAKAVLAMAQANQYQAASGGGLIFTASEIRDINYGLEPLDDDDAHGIDGVPEEPVPETDSAALDGNAPGAGAIAEDDQKSTIQAPGTPAHGNDGVAAEKPVVNASAVRFTRGRAPVSAIFSSPHVTILGKRRVAQIQYAKLAVQSREDRRHRERQRGAGTYSRITARELTARAGGGQ